MKQNKLHINFQLNGNSFLSVDEFLIYSRTISIEINLFLIDWFSNDKFINIKTSGSTGKPKWIVLQKKQMINSAFATGNYFNLQENTTALLCLSPAYIAGKMMLIRAIILGWKLDVINPDSYPLKNIKKVYDFSAMVPLQLENSLNNIAIIKKIIVGGGVVSKELQKKLQSKKTAIFATYGMTETITHIAVKKLNNFNSPQNNTIRADFYQVLPNVTIYRDNRNCLVIGAKKIASEVIFTNDVVSLISDTEFEWLGRFDNVINSGGIKLHPEKIEEKLSEIIDNRFFVTGIKDETLGQKLILIIEKNTNSNLVDIALKNKIKNLKTISKFEIPKEIYFVDSFIETETKKIQRSKTLNLIKF